MSAVSGYSSITFPCIRITLLFFNIAFWFCGLIIIWTGIWLHTELQNFLKVSSEYSKAAPLVLVIIGSIIIVVATLACSCIVKVQQTMLVIYGAFLVMILFTVITLSAYVYTYKDQLTSGITTGIQNDIRNYTLEVNHSTVLDFVQEKLKCCGAGNYTDWENSAQQRPPTSCCAVPLNICNTLNPNHIYEVGCAAKLTNLVDQNLALIGSTASIIALFPFFGAIMTFFLASTAKKHGYEPII